MNIVELLLEALEEVEWVEGELGRYCPWCDGRKYGSGHMNNCTRQEAIAAYYKAMAQLLVQKDAKKENL